MAGEAVLLDRPASTLPTQERVETDAVSPEISLTKNEEAAIDDMLFGLYSLSQFGDNDSAKVLGAGDEKAVLSMNDVRVSLRRAAEDLKLLFGGSTISVEEGERLKTLTSIFGDALYSRQPNSEDNVPHFASVTEAMSNYLGNKWTEYYNKQFEYFLAMQGCFINNNNLKGKKYTTPNEFKIDVGTPKDSPPKNIPTLNSDWGVEHWRERHVEYLDSHADVVDWRIRHAAHTQAVIATLQGARVIGEEPINAKKLLLVLMPLVYHYKDHEE